MTYDKILEMERERFIRYGYTIELLETEAYAIMDYLSQIKRDNIVLYKVNPGTLEIIILENEFIYYDFHGFPRDGVVGTGYYWKCQLQKDDSRIGRRKLYSNTKGTYFMESGYRHYLSDYITYK